MPPQIGPATNGVYHYDVLDDSGTLIGNVVVTAASPPEPYAANEALWTWTAALTTFPDKFRLAYKETGSAGSSPWTFEDGALTGTSGPPSPSTFTVHRIRRGSPTGTIVGHCWNKGTGPRIQWWSGVPAELDASGKYKDRTTADLYFEELGSPPTIDSSWLWRNDTV